MNMMASRMRIPNGVVTSDQLRFIATALGKYGDDEVVTIDITTRQNLQLRGLKVIRSHANLYWRRRRASVDTAGMRA
jgi:sulfite reductase beta subunit-like hemoprotein